MILDVLWKYFRKSLSNNLYQKLKFSRFGRAKSYYTLPTYTAIFEHYKSNLISFSNKVILELGSGLQFFTAMHFLNNGASRVILVDPIFKNRDVEEILQSHAELFCSELKQKIPIDIKKIEVFDSLESIPVTNNEKVDILCSHFVLEHFQELESYFRESKRLISPEGCCYSFVDLSDHTYHIFNSKKQTANIYKSRIIYHLRYSDEFYRRISDERCWVNRLLFPVYVQLAANYDFKIVNKHLSKCKKTKIHQDVLSKLPYTNEEELYVSHFSLLLRK